MFHLYTQCVSPHYSTSSKQQKTAEAAGLLPCMEFRVALHGGSELLQLAEEPDKDVFSTRPKEHGFKDLSVKNVEPFPHYCITAAPAAQTLTTRVE